MAEDLGARAFAAARALVGVRFLSQGRDRSIGLDCVGLVWAAYAAAGRILVAPAGYPLRGWPRERIEAALAAAGFSPVDDRRAIIVRLTPRGLKEFTGMARAHQAWVDGLLSEFDATEADTLIRHLDGLSGRIRNGGSRA